MAMLPAIGVGVPTWNAETQIDACLLPILASPLKPKVLVVDSSSRDRTVSRARALGAETLVIPQREFNHGATRELIRHRLGTEIVVFLTQDAVPQEAGMLERLVAPIAEGKASIAYARQLPRAGAGYLEAFARGFNYPGESELRGLEDVKRFGSYTFFCSNSCAAWSNRALDAIGGFQHVLTAEDTLATTKLLLAGHRIAYCADAEVRHSHDYTMSQEFRRYFDTGLTRSRYKDVLFVEGGDEKRGLRFTIKLLRSLAKERPWLLPYAVINTAAKMAGYRLGYHANGYPLWLKRQLSLQPYFWRPADGTGRAPVLPELSLPGERGA